MVARRHRRGGARCDIRRGVRRRYHEHRKSDRPVRESTQRKRELHFAGCAAVIVGGLVEIWYRARPPIEVRSPEWQGAEQGTAFGGVLACRRGGEDGR